MIESSPQSFLLLSKRAGPLEEEEVAAAVAVSREYTDLEGHNSGGGQEPAPDSDDGLLCDMILTVVGPFAIGIGFWYTMLGRFYLPPEAGPNGGGGIAIAGAVLLAVGAAALAALVVRVCCLARRRRTHV